MRIFYGRKDKPPGYYRSGLSVNDLRLAMQSGEWMPVFQIAALVSDKMPPEAKARSFELHRGKGTQPLEKRVMQGAHEIVIRALCTLARKGIVEKNGVGHAAKYRWITPKDDPSVKDQA